MKKSFTCKTSLNTSRFIIQDGVDALETAGGKFVVILFVSRRGSGEHYKIAVLASGRTLFRIVLFYNMN